MEREKYRAELENTKSLLRKLVEKGKSICITGQCGTGKITLLNPLIPFYTDYANTFIINVNNDNLLEKVANLSLKTIVLGEMRGDEVKYVIELIEEGVQVLTTFHANSIESAYERMVVALCRTEKYKNYSLDSLKKIVKKAFPTVICMERTPNRTYQVKEVTTEESIEDKLMEG